MAGPKKAATPAMVRHGERARNRSIRSGRVCSVKLKKFLSSMKGRVRKRMVQIGMKSLVDLWARIRHPKIIIHTRKISSATGRNRELAGPLRW